MGDIRQRALWGTSENVLDVGKPCLEAPGWKLRLCHCTCTAQGGGLLGLAPCPGSTGCLHRHSTEAVDISAWLSSWCCWPGKLGVCHQFRQGWLLAATYSSLQTPRRDPHWLWHGVFSNFNLGLNLGLPTGLFFDKPPSGFIRVQLDLFLFFWFWTQTRGCLSGNRCAAIIYLSHFFILLAEQFEGAG